MGPAVKNWKPGHFHKFFIRYGKRSIALPTLSLREGIKNPLIALWFGLPTPSPPENLLHCNKTRVKISRKNSLANFSSRYSL